MTLTKKQQSEVKIIAKAVLSKNVKSNHFLNLCPLLANRACRLDVENSFLLPTYIFAYLCSKVCEENACLHRLVGAYTAHICC